MKKIWIMGVATSLLSFTATAQAQYFQAVDQPRWEANRAVGYQDGMDLELEPESAELTSQRVSQQLRAQYQTPTNAAGPNYSQASNYPAAYRNGPAAPSTDPRQPSYNRQPNYPTQPTYQPAGSTANVGNYGYGNGSAYYSRQEQPVPPQPVAAGPSTTQAPTTGGIGPACSACGAPAGACACGGYGSHRIGTLHRRAHQIANSSATVGCDTACSTDICADDCGTGICGVGLLGDCCDTYTVSGIGWLYLKRDGADFQPLSYENGSPGTQLSVSDADFQSQNGIEAFIARQSCEGRGWELRYWGLFEDDSFAQMTSMPRTELGLSGVAVGGAGDAWTLFNSADFHQIGRETEFHNFEFNLLRFASSCGCDRNIILRGIAGVRVIRFNDSLAYSAYSGSSFGSSFESLKLHSSVANTLVAGQLGGSGEYCITNRLRLSLGSKVGVGSNFIDADQCLVTADGIFGTNSSGNMYSYSNSESDLALFGELNTSLYYHVTDCVRLSVGYRLFGISGVALAQDQFPYDYSDENDINSINRDGGLLLHGLTVGAEFCH